MRVGADEAGKGPVLGPMVAAAVRADPEALPEDIADSKCLTAPRRESLAARLETHANMDIGVAVIPVSRIDDPTTDMNTLTVASQVEALSDLSFESRDEPIVVDAGDVSESRFARRVREGVADNTTGDTGSESAITLIAEHGADEEYPIVGAASVVAKIERDRRIATLAEEYGDIGSGYPSDQTTRRFLAEYVRDHGELPACARSSWQTAADVLAAAEQSALSEF